MSNTYVLDEMTNLLIELVAEKLEVPAGSLALETAFEDLDLDSLVLLELSVLIESRLGVRLSDLAMAEAGTIAGTAHLLADLTAQASAEPVSLLRTKG